MKHQLQTIREALNLALTWHDAKYEHPFIKQALTALSELERMAGEPVAWKHDCAALLANDVELWIDNCPHCGRPRAAPSTHQPQYEAGDMASAHNDGFRAGVASVVKQPQEEHLTITWDEHQTRILAVTMQDEEGRILKVLAEAPSRQPKAEAVKWGVDWGTHGDRTCVSIIKKHSDGTIEVVANEYEPEANVARKAPQQAEAVPPANCRQRLKHDGKAYPRSSCAACGEFSPKWKECDAAMAQGEKP